MTVKDVTVYVKSSEGAKRIMRELAEVLQKENRRRKACGGAPVTYQISVVSETMSMSSKLMTSNGVDFLKASKCTEAGSGSSGSELSGSHRDIST